MIVIFLFLVTYSYLVTESIAFSPHLDLHGSLHQLQGKMLLPLMFLIFPPPTGTSLVDGSHPICQAKNFTWSAFWVCEDGPCQPSALFPSVDVVEMGGPCAFVQGHINLKPGSGSTSTSSVQKRCSTWAKGVEEILRNPPHPPLN